MQMEVLVQIRLKIILCSWRSSSEATKMLRQDHEKASKNQVEILQRIEERLRDREYVPHVGRHRCNPWRRSTRNTIAVPENCRVSLIVKRDAHQHKKALKCGDWKMRRWPIKVVYIWRRLWLAEPLLVRERFLLVFLRGLFLAHYYLLFISVIYPRSFRTLRSPYSLMTLLSTALLSQPVTYRPC